MVRKTTWTSKRRGRAVRWLAAMAALAAASAAAQEPEIERRMGFRVGLEHTDNLGRVAADVPAESLTYGTVGLDLGALRENRRMTAYINGDVEYHHYDSEEFDAETQGNLGAGLNLRVVPGVFDWDFAGQTGQVRQDPLRGAGPDNRERVTVLATGPRLTFAIADRNTLSVNAGYMDRRWSEREDLDSTVRSADIGWFRALSPSRQLGFVVGGRRVEYDAPLLPHYDVQTAYLAYSRELGAGAVELDLGANRLEYQEKATTGPYIRGAWRRELSPRSILSLTASRSYEDAADQLGDSGMPGEGARGVGYVSATRDPLQRSRFGAIYTLTRPRATVSFGSEWSRERYEGDTRLDRDAWRGSTGLDYRFSPATTGSLGLYYRRERFDDFDVRSASERGASLGLARRLSRTWDLRFSYRFADRRSRAGRGYEENRYMIGLHWAPVL